MLAQLKPLICNFLTIKSIFACNFVFHSVCNTNEYCFKWKSSSMSTQNTNDTLVLCINFIKRLCIQIKCRRRQICDKCGERKPNRFCILKTHHDVGRSNTWDKLLTYKQKNSFKGIDIVVSNWQLQFICQFSYFFTSNRLSKNINFPIVDASKLKLYPFPSLFTT